jgi:hypothetical protein
VEFAEKAMDDALEPGLVDIDPGPESESPRYLEICVNDHAKRLCF